MIFRERYSHEIPKWARKLGVWRVNRDSIDFRWGYFAPKPGFELVLHRGTYFDTRWSIGICLGWGKVLVHLPFKTKLKEGCDMPQYGIAIHNSVLWVYRGGKYKDGQTSEKYWAWDLPFFSYTFKGHWIENKAGEWVKMRDKHDSAPQPYEFRQEEARVEKHQYKYIRDSGEIQDRVATCTHEKRKWHRKWFPFLTMERRVVDVEFDKKIGERVNSWKGGCIGCSWELLHDESIADGIRRMEKERKF